jgi:hypothetical protein
MKKVWLLGISAMIIVLLAIAIPGCGKSQSASEEIKIYAKISGLEKGDTVEIIGGRIPENSPEGEYCLEDVFKVTVNENGRILLPIHKEGKWSIEAAAVNYGEIPEFYEITVEKGTHRTLQWELHKSVPLGKLMVKSNPSGSPFEIVVTPETEAKDPLMNIQAEFEGKVMETPFSGRVPEGKYKIIWGEVEDYPDLKAKIVEVNAGKSTIVTGNYKLGETTVNQKPA